MPGTKLAEDRRQKQILTASYDLALRGGLPAVTVRDVARKSGSSVGLVLFHFGTKDRLLLALLEMVLAKAMTFVISPEIAAIPDPLEQFVALLRQEMARLTADPKRNRLFFEFWSAGLWSRDIRVRMQRELDRYREAFRPMAEAVISADPDRFVGVTPASLAAVAVSFIKGCAVQSMVEPLLDTAGFLRAAETLLGAPSLVKD